MAAWGPGRSGAAAEAHAPTEDPSTERDESFDYNTSGACVVREWSGAVILHLLTDRRPVGPLHSTRLRRRRRRMHSVLACAPTLGRRAHII